MQARIVFALQCVIALMLPDIVPAEDGLLTRVGVLRFISMESDDRYDVVVSQVTDTISLTLQLLPDYAPVVVDPETIEGLGVAIPLAEAAGAVADEYGFDAVLFGTATRREPRGTSFRAGVYDASTRTVSVSVTREAESLMGIFETADDLVLELLQEFSGTTIEFGAVAIRTSPRNTPVAIRFGDNTFTPPNGRIENVLAGTIDVAVLQDRFQPETVIAEHTITVTDGRTATLDVEIPELTVGEERYLAELNQTIADNHRFAARDRIVGSAVEELLRISGGPEFSPVIPPLREYAEEIAQLWAIQRTHWNIPYTEDADAASALQDILPLLDDPGSSTAIKAAARHAVQLYAETQYLAVFEMVNERRWDAAHVHFERIESVRSHLPTERYREIVETRGRLAHSGEEYAAIEEAGTGVWPWVVAGVGAAALGTAGVLFFADPVGALDEENQDLYDEYRSATTTDQRTNIRTEIDGNEETAGNYQVIRWTSVGVGTAALGAGIFGIVNRTRAPSRYYRDQVVTEYGDNLNAAEAFFSDSAEAVAIVTGTNREMTVVIGDANPQAPPAIAGDHDVSGESLASMRIVEGTTVAEYTATINRGRNLILTYTPTFPAIGSDSWRVE